jgi:hypothetical protein
MTGITIVKVEFFAKGTSVSPAGAVDIDVDADVGTDVGANVETEADGRDELSSSERDVGVLRVLGRIIVAGCWIFLVMVNGLC